MFAYKSVMSSYCFYIPELAQASTPHNHTEVSFKEVGIHIRAIRFARLTGDVFLILVRPKRNIKKQIAFFRAPNDEKLVKKHGL